MISVDNNWRVNVNCYYTKGVMLVVGLRVGGSDVMIQWQKKFRKHLQ